MAEFVGIKTCPVCKFAGARIVKTKTGRPMLHCDRCSAQVFARGERSAALLAADVAPVDPDERETAPPPPGPPGKPKRAVSFLDDL